jgi:Carboxypeptidase regulatory-like domain/TonB dependent receptor-like, beta-barrel
MNRLCVCLVSFCILVFGLTAAAQIQNGQFTGTVTDPTGAVVSGAKVTATNTATSLSVSATTNSSGSYTLKELPPGSYNITVGATGFRNFTTKGVTLNAGTVSRVDAKLELGQANQVVEVSGAASAVNTETSQLATTINSTQISDLPLNGHNVYDLMQMAPGAVNSAGVDFEPGHNTVVNGVRQDFNGFLINGESNKDISGGVNNVPIQDTVQEFQQLELNTSAQYGSSAGTINNLVTKSGTNAFHGSAWEYFRNSALDANEYFLNQQGVPKPGLHFNQFGATFGGPLIKDKLFFFGSYQGDRFNTIGNPQTLVVESPQWEQAVMSGAPDSVAALLYKDFKPAVAGTPFTTLDQYVASSSYGSYAAIMCDKTYPTGFGSIGTKLQPILGATAADITAMQGMGCGNTPGAPFVGTVGDRSTPTSPGSIMPFENNSVAIFGTQTQTLGNLFNGNEAMGRIDYNWSTNNRLFVEFNWLHETDQFGPCYSYCTRGFTNPARYYYPNGQLSFVHTFSANVLNEFRLGYTQNNLLITPAQPGVPAVSILDGTASFGSYNGYPQTFKDHEYSYSDMVSISHGNHNLKIGADLTRNLENSEFNVGRPSYLFNDPFQFAADAPGAEIAGVDPGFANGGSGSAQLETNLRHFRNWDVGAYFQDDWKATKRLTLNLGLRWDLYTRHTEEDNLATTLLLGPGTGVAEQLENANAPLGSATCNPADPSTVVLAGVCGPGGFAAADRLGPNRYKDFGPRVGFAYDVFGDGRTSLRGGFGMSYEGTLYNPLSNSRWNPPYYSFNLASNALLPIFAPATIIYGPTTCTGGVCSPSGATPTYTGPGTNPGMGILGDQATGNIAGWYAGNPDQAYLTGIVLPTGVKDPYVYNYFLSVQHELMSKWTLEVDYVGTTGHDLFRAENINRIPGGALPEGSCVTDNLGRQICGLANALNPAGLPNPNYGTLRTWENAVNSNYNGLQVSLKKQMSHGVLFNVNYTYSHSLDNGSTWHSGATTSNGAAGGEGYTTDQTDPHLDWGNSIFDIRHRLVVNYVIDLPGQHLTGVLGAVAGGWSYNGIWSFQSGAHWEPYAGDGIGPADLVNGSGDPCSAADVNSGNCTNIGGDWNLDNGENDRPMSTSSTLNASRSTWENGWCPGGYAFANSGGGCANGSPNQANLPVLSAPCLGCVSTMERNQWTGPGQWFSDMTLAKNFKLTERVNMKFEWQAFNVFNRANFLLAVNGGGAHNQVSDGAFGQAAGTLNARNMQFGLHFSF